MIRAVPVIMLAVLVASHAGVVDGDLRHLPWEDPFAPKWSSVQMPRPLDSSFSPSGSLGAGCCALTPDDLRYLYNLSELRKGGQVSIAGAYKAYESDIQAYAAVFGLDLPEIHQVCVAEGPGCYHDSQRSIEATMDFELLLSLGSPARLTNYMAADASLPAFLEMYAHVAENAPAGIVLTTWSVCEASISVAFALAAEEMISKGTRRGQLWIVASGDRGSRECSLPFPTVGFPASSPLVFSVGGTSALCPMTVAAPGCSGRNEAAWSGSGGGHSRLFQRPTWQEGCGVPAGEARLVPDLALAANAEPGHYVIYLGVSVVVGGTSAAAPLLASSVAHLSSSVHASLLDEFYSDCSRFARDIIEGENQDYRASPGYDLMTGVGAPDLGAVLGRLEQRAARDPH